MHWPNFDYIKPVLTHARFSGTLLALGLTLLFASQSFLETFALAEFRDEARVWIGPATFVLAGVWGVQVFSLCATQWRRWRSRRARRKEMIELLNTLTIEERYVLASCVKSGCSTFFANITDRTAHSLHSKELAPRLAGGGNILEWPSVITRDVWRHINDNEQVLLRGMSFEELRRAAGQVPLPHERA